MIQLNRSVATILGLVLVLWLLNAMQAGGVAGAVGSFRDTLVYVIPAFLIGIVLHEFAHAYVAWKLGDPTGRSQGRITLNPLAHLDPLGTLMIVVAGFGWANPVPINTANFKHRTRDTALAAGAGPLTNLLIAGVAILLIQLLPPHQRDPMLMRGSAFSLFEFLFTLANVNAMLAVLNLIPVKPLDGHHFLEVMLPPKQYWAYKRNEMTISLVALVLLMMGAFGPVFRAVSRVVMDLTVKPYWGVP
jgi:Zn-dependent protease